MSTQAATAKVTQRARRTTPAYREAEVAAGSLFATPDELAALAQHRASAVRAEVARNDAVPADVIRQLAGDRNGEVRALAAIRGVEAGCMSVEEAAPILLLSRGRRFLLIDALETSTSSSLIVLALAVGHREYVVAAAESAYATAEQFGRLLALGHSCVDRVLVQNPRCPDEVLRELLSRPDDAPPWPSDGQSNFSKHYWRLAKTFSFKIRVILHPNSSEHTLEQIYSGDLFELSPQVLVALAQRPVLSVLLPLAGHLDADVRTAVAAQPHTPAVILSDLAWDESIHVRTAIFNNPGADVDTRAVVQRMGIRK